MVRNIYRLALDLEIFCVTPKGISHHKICTCLYPILKRKPLLKKKIKPKHQVDMHDDDRMASWGGTRNKLILRFEFQVQ